MTTDEDKRALVLVPDRSLANTTAGAKRILSEMIGEMLALGQEKPGLSKPIFTVLVACESFGRLVTHLLQKRWNLAGNFDLKFHCLDSIYGHESELVELVGSCVPDLIVAYAYMNPDDRKLFSNLRSTYGVPTIAFSGWPNPDLEIDPESGGLVMYFDATRLVQSFDDAMERSMRFRPRKNVSVARDENLEQSRLDALVLEGKRILLRKGMTEEDIQAFGLFCRAGQAGHGEAQYFLFHCYMSGWGVLKNHTEAIKWLKKSSDSGCALACAKLGIFFYVGFSEVPKDQDQGIFWLKKAVESDASLLRGGVGARLCEIYEDCGDITESLKWYRKRVEAGGRNAISDGFTLCFRKRVFETDLIEAYSWFQLSEAEFPSHYRRQRADELAQMMSTAELAKAAQLFTDTYSKYHANL